MTSKPKKSKRIRNAPGEARRRINLTSPLARLVKSHALDIYEHTAADEIIAADHMSHGLPVSRDMDLDIPMAPMRFDAADDHQARRVDIARIYPAWRQDLASTYALAVTDTVLFSEISLTAIDEHQHWRRGTARMHLKVALRHFAALRGNVPRDARDWKFVPPAKKEKAA